jgi:hypothetical protein
VGRLLAYIYKYNKEKLLDMQHLKYNSQNCPFSSESSMIPCLSRVREINLMHYQGVLACKFLLCNAAVMETIWCEEFAEVTLFIRHIKCFISGWVAYELTIWESNSG